MASGSAQLVATSSSAQSRPLAANLRSFVQIDTGEEAALFGRDDSARTEWPVADFAGPVGTGREWSSEVERLPRLRSFTCTQLGRLRRAGQAWAQTKRYRRFRALCRVRAGDCARERLGGDLTSCASGV